MIKFNRLTRGIKLLVDHIFDPITSVMQTLTATGIPLNQYEKEEGTFRVNLTIPVANQFFSGAVFNKTSALTVPFILPPLQEDFGANPNFISGYDLIEVSIGQDTRAEAASLKAATLGPTEVGNLQMGAVSDLELSIKSHKINSVSFDSFNNEVFSIKIPSIALLNPYSRLNPHVQSGIAIPFNHQDSYLVQVTGDTNLVSLFVSLKFKSKLRTRDIGVAAQNQTPLSARNFVAQTPTTPAANTTIEADTNDGVSTNFKLIDSLIGNKFRGGYNRWGMSRYKENIIADAGYEVITVPMFGSWPHVSGGTRMVGFEVGNDLPYETMPWVNASASKYETADRALVPINYPITIHHVIVAMNYTGGSGELTTRPTHAVAPGLKHEVGVGLMSGHRSDNIKHQQVAFLDWLPSTVAGSLIDRGDFKHVNSSGAASGYSWDILNCPLTGGTNGTGFTPQGKPIFAASGNTATNARSNIGTGAPLTANGEQVLDIRWKISDSTGNPATWSARQTILGYNGCWVYLICKKTVS
jgi:hypothetical protein